ncbi:MAG: ABC transporter substrate-binding protein, partial [Bacteroidales bacterium]|nr:ABC transporter substrate-binding protein [Bacteroidales bacterium]
ANMFKLSIYLLIIIIFTSVSVSSQQLTKLRYLPHWLPQAQFAGYYMAKEMGIYKKYGLVVEIKTGGPGCPAATELENGNCDIASMFLSGAIQAYGKGVKLVDICQLSKRSALIFITKKKTGITKPDDFNGKKIGIWRSDFQELPMAFLKKYNIDATIVPITSSVNAFYYDIIDIVCVMWYNEYHTILNYGINPDELNVFFLFDHDLNFPEDGIFCKEDYYNKNKKVCENFVKATLEGWNYAFEHEDETIDLVMKYMKNANVPANAPHQKWMFERMKDIFIYKYQKLNGKLSKELYLKTAKVLLETGKIKSIPDFNEFDKTR